MFDKSDYMSFIPVVLAAAVMYFLQRARERIRYSPEKKHWYCFAFVGGQAEFGRECRACTYTGYQDKLITMPRIKENKRYAGVKDDAVLLSVSYLGYMTKEQMENGTA
jgi:hypothetical protein